MATVTPEQYYEGDESQHGDYQYVSLKEIIDGLQIQALDNDSMLKGTKRFSMLFHAKMLIKEVHKKAANEILAIEFTVPNNLVFTLPQDYVDYVRLSLVERDLSDGSLRLKPLDFNNNINIATGYLQDNNYQIIFDEDGQIITVDSSNAYAHPYKKYSFGEAGGQSRLDTSKLSQHGEFTIDNKRGKILFSSELSEREVVLEYASDGLQANLREEMITVHKHLEQTLRDGIYYRCIELKRTVSASEKERARRAYKGSLHQSKLDLAGFDIFKIDRTMRKKTMIL